MPRRDEKKHRAATDREASAAHWNGWKKADNGRSGFKNLVRSALPLLDSLAGELERRRTTARSSFSLSPMCTLREGIQPGLRFSYFCVILLINWRTIGLAPCKVDLMLPSVQIRAVTVAYTAVLAIRMAGASDPIYCAPFRDQRPTAAFALNEHEVIAFGDQGRLAVLDLESGKTIRECETDAHFGSAAISLDLSTIYVWKSNNLTCWQSDSLEKIALYDAYEVCGSAHRIIHSETAKDFEQRFQSGEVRFLPLARDFHALTDGRLCIASGGAVEELYLIDPSAWLLQILPVTDALLQSVSLLLPADDAVFDRDPEADRCAEALFSVCTPLAGLTEEAISAAFNDISTRFADGVSQFVAFNMLRLIFALENRKISEEELCGHLVDDRMLGVVAPLRRLLLTYLENIKGGWRDQPWYFGDEGEAALCHLLRALMLLDGPHSYDIMRAYMLKRDGEHECFSGDVLYPEMLKLYRLSNEVDIRFGIFFVLNRIWGGRGPAEFLWNTNGLLDIAPSIVSAERFADIILNELEAFRLAPTFGRSGSPHYLGTLIRALEPHNSYTEALLSRLRDRAPELVKEAEAP